MTLQQLTYFCAVCRYHSIVRAAKALYISQPTISTAIHELEKEFHISLFLHTPNHIHLTEEGAAFYERANDLLQRARNMQEEFSQAALSVHPIRVGIPPILSTIFLPALSEAFEAVCPVPLELSECASHRAAELVQGEKLDILLGNLDIYNLEQYHYYTMKEDHYVYCVSKNHPLSHLTSVSLPALSEETLLLFHMDSVQTLTITAAFRALGLTPRVKLYLSQLTTMMNYLESGRCGAFLYSSIPIDEERFVRIPVTPEISTKFGILWKKGIFLPHGLEEFIRFVKRRYVR